MTKFSKNIRKHIDGLSYEKLSRMSGYTSTVVSGIINGKHQPRLNTAFCLAACLDLSLDDLVEWFGCRYYCESELPNERFKKVRKLKGISINKLYETTGVKMNTIWRFETGRNDMSLENAIKLAKALDFSLDWLCGR